MNSSCMSNNHHAKNISATSEQFSIQTSLRIT
jgi:hypothetical protein